MFEFNFKSIEEGRSRIDGTKNPCEVDGYSVDYVDPKKSSIISIYDESRGCKFARLKIACKMKSSTNVFPPNFNYKLEILGVYKPEGNDFEPLITSEEIKIEAAITTDSNEIVSCVDPLPDAPQPQ